MSRDGSGLLGASRSPIHAHSEMDAASLVRRRVLAMCLGGIGDTILSFAALRDLRRGCPNDHLTALVMWPQAAELISDLGVFDEVHQHHFQRERLYRSAWAALRERNRSYDASILAFPANRFEYNALAWLVAARRRLGHTYLRGSDAANLRFLLTDRIQQTSGRHVVDENRALVANYLGRAVDELADTRLGPLDPIFHHQAERMLAHLPRPLIGIHAGSSAYKGLDTKRWPIERFGELCRRVQYELGLQPLVFGNPDEFDLKLRIQELCPQVFFAHGPSIRHTAALLGRCDVFVSNDSALAHLASAVEVPTMMLCGPTHPGEVGPYGHPHRALTSDVACSPCFQVGRAPMRCVNPEPRRCLKEISVDRVLDAIAKVRGSLRLNSTGTVQQHTHRISLPVLGPAA